MPFDQDVMLALGRIEQKVDGLKELRDDDRTYLNQVSGRVRVLEDDKTKRKGAVAVVSAFVSAAVAIIVAVVKGLFQ